MRVREVAAIGVALLVVASGVVAISLSRPAGGPAVTWQLSGDVGCTLEPVTGTLADRGGRTVLEAPRWQGPFPAVPLTAVSASAPDPILVRWPAGWTVTGVFGGLGGLEVANASGKVEAHTGELVAVWITSQAQPGMPDVVDGSLFACPTDVMEGGWPPSAGPSP